MHVEIRNLRDGRDNLAGVLRFVDSRIVAAPDCRLLRNILSQPVYDGQTGRSYDAAGSPRKFLRVLCRQYRSAYLRASEPIEDEDDGKALARHYADFFNAVEDAGGDLGHEHLHDPSEELARTNWRVTRQPSGTWVAHRWNDAGSLRGWRRRHKGWTAEESQKHPRGQPQNAGEFASKGADSSGGDVADGNDIDPSAMAERDWLENGFQSAAFKRWFGDWENDPENASKVVNEDGQPQKTFEVKKVYHGTGGRFDQFSKERIGANGLHVGKGFYFAEDRRIADTYAKNRDGDVLEVYLKIRNPLDMGAIVGVGELDRWEQAALDLAPKRFNRQIWREELASQRRLVKSQDGSLPALLAWSALCNHVGSARVNDIIARLGYDGLTHMSRDQYGTMAINPREAFYGRVWIAFEPTQIKSVDNRGTFDPRDPVLHKSYRPGGVKTAERAPKGGIFLVNLRGETQMYKGGQWIPAQEIANLPPAERARLEQARQQSRIGRIQRGDISPERVQYGLRPHARELSQAEAARAVNELRALHAYHGDLTLHRIEQLADQQRGFLKRGKLNDKQRGRIRGNLARLHAMVDLARAWGVTGKVPRQEPVAAPPPTVPKADQPSAHALEAHRLEEMIGEQRQLLARLNLTDAQRQKFNASLDDLQRLLGPGEKSAGEVAASRGAEEAKQPQRAEAPMSPAAAARALARQASGPAQPKEGDDAASSLNRQLIQEGSGQGQPAPAATTEAKAQASGAELEPREAPSQKPTQTQAEKRPESPEEAKPKPEQRAQPEAESVARAAEKGAFDAAWRQALKDDAGAQALYDDGNLPGARQRVLSRLIEQGVAIPQDVKEKFAEDYEQAAKSGPSEGESGRGSMKPEGGSAGRREERGDEDGEEAPRRSAEDDDLDFAFGANAPQDESAGEEDRRPGESAAEDPYAFDFGANAREGEEEELGANAREEGDEEADAKSEEEDGAPPEREAKTPADEESAFRAAYEKESNSPIVRSLRVKGKDDEARVEILFHLLDDGVAIPNRIKEQHAAAYAKAADTLAARKHLRDLASNVEARWQRALGHDSLSRELLASRNQKERTNGLLRLMRQGLTVPEAVQAEHKDAYHDAEKRLSQGRYRSDLARSQTGEAKEWSDKAFAEGITPKHLHAVADEIMKENAERVDQRRRLLAFARNSFASGAGSGIGYDARALTNNLRSGHVEDSIPMLDLVADSVALQFPDEFRHLDHMRNSNSDSDTLEGRLLELFKEGIPQRISRADAYEKALDYLREQKEYETAAHHSGSQGASANPGWDEDDESWGESQWKSLRTWIQKSNRRQDAPGQQHLFDPAKHPHAPPGPHGGQFVSTGQDVEPSASSLANALDRYANRAKTALGGGLFGGEDLQARHGFAKLPDGVAIVFTQGEFEGKTGKIVRDEDKLTGAPRIVAQVNGRVGLVPISPGAVEPLDPRLSWRVEGAGTGQEETQGNLFAAEHFLPKRSPETTEETRSASSIAQELDSELRPPQRGFKRIDFRMTNETFFVDSKNRWFLSQFPAVFPNSSYSFDKNPSGFQRVEDKAALRQRLLQDRLSWWRHIHAEKHRFDVPAEGVAERIRRELGLQADVRYPSDSSSRYVYVDLPAGGQFKIRLADHPQPVDYDAETKKVGFVGGFDTQTGARHSAADVSIDPETKFTVEDALQRLRALRESGLPGRVHKGFREDVSS